MELSSSFVVMLGSYASHIVTCSSFGSYIYTISITHFNLASGQLLTTKFETLTEGIVCDISKYCKSKPGNKILFCKFYVWHSPVLSIFVMLCYCRQFAVYKYQL
jgi:hypothetical protein